MTRTWSWLDRLLRPGPILEGTRHSVLISFAGKLRYRGTNEGRILSILREVNQDRRAPHLRDGDLPAMT